MKNTSPKAQDWIKIVCALGKRDRDDVELELTESVTISHCKRHPDDNLTLCIRPGTYVYDLELIEPLREKFLERANVVIAERQAYIAHREAEDRARDAAARERAAEEIARAVNAQ